MRWDVSTHPAFSPQKYRQSLTLTDHLCIGKKITRRNDEMRKYYKQDSDLGLSMNGKYDNNVNSASKNGSM